MARNTVQTTMKIIPSGTDYVVYSVVNINSESLNTIYVKFIAVLKAPADCLSQILKIILLANM